MGTVRYTSLNGELVSEKRDGVERDYLPNPLSSTVALLDVTQTKTDTFTQWPYGEERSRTGTTATPFRFGGTIGSYLETGPRVYERARHLNTAHGRWMTPDPSGIRPAEPNSYRYVRSNPATWVDRSGEGIWKAIPCAACLGAAAAVCSDCGWDWSCWKRCLGEIWEGLPVWIRTACLASCAMLIPAPKGRPRILPPGLGIPPIIGRTLPPLVGGAAGGGSVLVGGGAIPAGPFVIVVGGTIIWVLGRCGPMQLPEFPVQACEGPTLQQCVTKCGGSIDNILACWMWWKRLKTCICKMPIFT